MNRAHRIADGVRSVVGWFNKIPTESHFLSRGTLTPAEFVEAGDQLVFQCPTWQWQSCINRRYQVFWLPPNKQFLLTRNIPCRYRIKDWEQNLCGQTSETKEGWLIPNSSTSASTEMLVSETPHVPRRMECTVTIEGGEDVAVQHEEEAEDDGEEKHSITRHSRVEDEDFVDLSEVNSSSKVDDGYTLLGNNTIDRRDVIPTRSYDLTITYDKYYQSPRLWLFGYDENGIPLRAEEVFQDIHSDYLSKTVTVDPHPFSGVPTVSIHPCKHASIIKIVAQNWYRNTGEARHDLALFILLKMVSSVVPTVNYDFTIDIDMPLGLLTPKSQASHVIDDTVLD